MAAKTSQHGQQGQQRQEEGQQVQGEGDYEAGRRYDKAAREFAESGKVEPAARDAAPGSTEEAEEMQQAEETGKSHSKGEGRLTSDKRRS
jgi:hypothetical protein